MAPKQSMDLLFHPKKKAKQVAKPPPPKANGASPVKKPKPKAEDDDDEDLKLPDGPFQEFRLLSSALNGWRYDVMKFDSRKPIDIFRWQQPIKLNRKDLRRDEAATNVAPEAVGPMLGPDGKPVIGVDGKMVMVDSEGRPIHANSTNGAGSSKDKDKGKEKDKGAAKKRFQRKTRQVFFVPEEVRQLRREERYPWVMEDSSSAQNEVWQGQMEDATKSETHGFFMPAANDVFKFVPAHRWYKFQKRLKHDLPTDTANVESMYTMSQKRDPQQWLASRKGKAVSASTAAMFKGEGDAAGAGAGGSGGQSLGPGGRRLKTVDSGMDHLFEDDEDGDASRRRKRELGEEGDLDEQVYEEDFADDDEKMEVDDNDEEAKETEERLKKEYKAANKQREAGVDESEEEDDGHPASKQSKAMQKLIQKREGGGAYDSDDEEKNPYASDEEEEEEEEPIVLQTAASAIQEQQQKIESRSQTPKPNGTAPARPSISTTVPPPGSRATSPVLSPNHGGHSLVAKRATSPKAYKPKVPNMSRGNSPLGGQSTVNSRATSPVAMDVDPKVNSLKRKAEDVPMSPASPGGTPAPTKPKKRKAAAVSLEELERLLIEWLRVNTTKTTRECSTHFAKYIGGQRAEFTGIVKKIAVVSKDGFMVLKSDALRAARAGSGAPSPAVVSAAPSPAAPSPGA